MTDHNEWRPFIWFCCLSLHIKQWDSNQHIIQVPATMLVTHRLHHKLYKVIQAATATTMQTLSFNKM